jgi:hypothetical protein
MCKQLMDNVKLLCGHKVDSIGALHRCNEAKLANKDHCDPVKRVWLGQTSRRYPCDDCITNGLYIKRGTKWEKA